MPGGRVLLALWVVFLISGFALAASILAGFAASFTFDSLGFPTFAGLWFVLFGAAGALWRFRDMDDRPTPFDRLVRSRTQLRPLLVRPKLTGDEDSAGQ